MFLRLAALLCALLVLATAAALAAEDGHPMRPLLPGIGSHDPRMRVDPDSAPWRAIGKLQANAGNLHAICTGTLIAPDTVLTAAHCVFNLRTGRYFPPESLHFLLGLEGDHFAAHARVRRIVTGPGYDPAERRRTVGSDWALLTLDATLGAGDRILPLRDRPPEIGSAVMIGGYSQDHALVLTGDTSCRIVARLADGNGRTLLRHDCTATRGVSGAPVLVRDGGQWRVAGVDVAAEMGVAAGYATTLEEVRKRF
jgi:protease YdgD